MKKAAFMAATASATTAIAGSNIKTQSSHQISVQDRVASSKRTEESLPEKTNCCSEKFAPRFDGLKFIETLVTAHR